MATYRVVRFYASPDQDAEVLAEGLTLAEAQERCHDPEGSSATCRGSEGRNRTAYYGPWFEGFQEER